MRDDFNSALSSCACAQTLAGVVGGGFSLLGPNKLTLGPVDLFGPKKRRFLSKWDFGEIDFTNDRLKLKINVNPTSWD